MAWRLAFPVDEPVDVAVTHVERETGNFFVQLVDPNSSKLDDLMEKIVHYVAHNSSGTSKAKSLKVGDACLAKYVDEVWYRGKILGVDKNGLKVFFVDYGNSDFVAKNDVMPAPEKFLALPPQAYACELANVKPVGGQWGTELLGKFEELIIEQTFVAQAISLKTNNVLVLSLYQDSTMTKLAVDPLISAGYLQRIDDVPNVESGPERSYKFLELDDFSFEDVHISYCENPHQFHCILLRNTTALHKLMEELENTYRDAAVDEYPLTSSCQDNPCCAKYSEDENWYRAIITSESPSPSGEITVKFVDYGNSESVHISNLMELDDRFLELPMQALECSLYGIKPKEDDEWSQDTIALFETLTNEKHLVTYVNKVVNNTAEVFLFDTSEETKDINYAQVLVDSGKAIAIKSLTDYKKAHSKRRKSSFGIINLVPNSTEGVVITNADSPSDFYCQLLKHSPELDKLMDDLSQYYDNIGDVDDTVTLPQAGMLCCGQYTEDDGWYRALILDSDIASRQVEVLYVDYGNAELLPIARIKELKPQFAALPQQAIPCCLYGVSPNAPSWTNQAIEAFQNVVAEKELEIKVVSHNESQRYSVSLMETVGNEVYSINKQLVQKGLAISDGSHPGVSVDVDVQDYHPPPVEVENYIDVEITHVENLEQFWCHLMTSSNEEMESLMANLQDYYDANPPKGTDFNQFIQGSPCCARFSEDKMWYRAKILEKMSNNRFRVRFIDYGNCEVLASKSVAVLNPEFLQLPVQAIECTLANLPPSEKRKNKFVDKFLEMVNGKELVCRLEEQDINGKYAVLIIDTVDGHTININEKMAEFIANAGKQPGKETAVQDVPKVAALNLTIGKEESVYITCVNSLGDFYCQLASTSTQLDNLMNNIEAFYRPLTAEEEAFTNPQVGNVCCARFTEDDGFYRAVVTKVSSGTIGVRYIDYGNCEDLPLSQIKSLNVSFTGLPAQCFNAKTFSSSCDTTAEFEAMVIDKELKAKIVKKDENGVFVVALSDARGTPLFSQQQQGTSKRAPCKVNQTRIPVGKKVHVFVTSVTSPDDFFCQLTETSADLDDLMNEMEEHYRPLGEQEEACTNPQIGEACCALFTEDDGFYRATVIKHSGNEVDVNYMDYGNSETISLSRIKVLHQKFTTLPTQGFRARVKIATAVSAAAFKDNVLDNEFDAKIVKETGNNIYEVDLFNADGAKMFGDAVTKNEAVVCQVKEADIIKDSKEHVYVTFFKSPENFFCQLVKTSTHLDELMDKLEEFYRPLGDGEECLTNPQVGDPCCAMFTEDDGWYRAVITKISGKAVEIKYVDYGNSEELPLSRVKRLLPCFAEMNIQGFSASLIGSGSMEKARAAIDGKELMVRVCDRKRSGVYNVEVYEMNGNRLFGSEQDEGKPKDIKSIKDFLNAYDITPGAQLDVCGSHCESPSSFYLHLVKNKEALEKIMTELSEVYSDLRPKDNAVANPVVGMFCAAKFPVDGGWYRAQILSIPSPNEVEVCYIDFGNSERVGLHDIKNLAPAFYSTAVQAVKCRLPGKKEDWSGSECEAFEILVLEQHLIADVKSVDSNSKTLTIDLFDTRGSENLNILNVLSAKTSKSQEKLPKLAALPRLQLKDVENVLVESAESLDSFVCQFSRFNRDLETVADMMYEMYQQGTPPNFVTIPLQVGDVIAAMFTEDETWYRATVSGKNPDGSVSVTFIDYGNSETISKSDVGQRVRYLGKDLLRYPPMRGVACSLSRVSTDGQRFSWTPRAHEAFVRYVVEKEFRARLSSDSEPYKTILEDKSGSLHTWLVREKLVASKESEPEVVQDDFYELEVEVGTSCDVYVTSVINPENFFIQQVANTEAIDKVMDDVQASSTDGSRGILMNIQTGTLCAAQYTVDDAWYRARVTKGTGPDSYEVVFVDYGNGEVLPRSRIKELDPSLLELPAQALCCSLQLKKSMSWSLEMVERFESATLDKLLNMTVVKALDGKLLVTLKDEGGSLLNEMFDSSSSAEQAPSKESVEVALSPFAVTGMQTAEVYISHLDSPGEFHVQFSGTEEELERLAEKAAEVYDGPQSENYKVDNPQQGMFCCARYSEDQAWYRALVTSVDLTNQTAAVLFVDHGNTDAVNISTDLRRLSADLTRSPCQAVACSLGRGAWSAEQCSSFEVAAMDKPLQATFKEYLDNVWLVSLKDGSVSLDQLLLSSREETPCIKEPCLSSEDEPSVYIVSVNSAADVRLQLSSHVNDLEALMSDIADKPPQGNLPTAERECGMYCLARFTEDEAWYRAKVLECDGEKTKVLYVDYGNEEWITDDRLAPISAQFSNLPEVCFRCSLNLSSVPATWTEDSGEKLIEMYGEHELRCQIMSKTDDGLSVTLFCGDENVLTKIVPSDKPTPVVKVEHNVEAPSTTPSGYKTKPLQKGDRKDVVCSHIESPRKLWCQFSDDQETLDNLMNRIDEVYSVLGPEELLLKSCDVGTPCCGQFLEDDGWYRAEILSMQDEGVLVRYIDYGNEEVLPTSRLRSLQSEFFETPREAIACLLNDVQANGDEWSPDALTLVEEFTSERSLAFEVSSVDVQGVNGVIYGRLEDDEVSLSDLLVEKTFAIDTSQQSSDEQSHPPVSYTNIPTQLGDKINLFYVSADSPARIWCQLSDSETELLGLMEKLGAFYGNLDEKELAVEEPLATGTAVCAQFTEDDSWYRAEILETSPNITVHFVDYGNCQELPHARVKQLKQDFAVLPKQAICFALSGVSPQSLEEWSEEKKVEMEELCSEKCYVGEILEITDGAMVVSLEDQESHVILLDELCQANLVKKSEEDVSKVDIQTEPDSVDDTSASEEKPVDDTPASEEQPVDDTPASEEQPVDDTSASKEQPVDDTSASEEQPVDDTSASEEQPVDDTSASEEQPVDDTSASQEQPVEAQQRVADSTPASEEQVNEETSEEEPAGNTPTLEEKPRMEAPPDERSSVEAENGTRTASPGDSEEDLNDATAVCHAIDRLLTEIETRTGEDDRSPAPETTDTALTEEGKTCSEEEAIAIIPSDEAPSIKVSADSTQQDIPSTNSNAEPDEKPKIEQPEEDGIDTVQKISMDNGDEIESNKSFEISAILQENLSALESDSTTTGSSSATPFLSPVGELTDDSPSDEMSAYLTPPNEPVTERVAEGQGVDSSPECDRSDNRRRYAFPEIQLGDIHKVKISHIESPSSFFCQLLRTEIEFSHLMEAIQKTFSEDTEDVVDVPTVGNPYCAQSPEDDKWYRAVVRHLGNDDHVNVTLVDLGKALTVPVERLKDISDELVTCLPRQALHCSLVDLEPADAEWSAHAVTKMTEVCSGKELEGIFRSRHHKVYNIYLRDPENDASDFVNKLLVDLKLAKVTGRDSDSGEGTDSNGNNDFNAESKSSKKSDEQSTTTGSHNENHQSECSKNDTIKCVEEFLDDLLDRAAKQALTDQREEDISSMRSEGGDETPPEVQQHENMSEGCSLETKTTENDVSECVEEETAEGEVKKDLSEVQKGLQSVEKCGEFHAQGADVCDVVPSGDVEQNDPGISNGIQEDRIQEDRKQIDENTAEIQKETGESESEMKEHQEFVHDEQNQEMSNHESAGNSENDHDAQDQVDEEIHTAAAEEQVKTDTKIDSGLSNEDLNSKEQDQVVDEEIHTAAAEEQVETDTKIDSGLSNEDLNSKEQDQVVDEEIHTAAAEEQVETDTKIDSGLSNEDLNSKEQDQVVDEEIHTAAAEEQVETDTKIDSGLSNEDLNSEEQEEKAEVKSEDEKKHIAPEQCPDQREHASIETSSQTVPATSNQSSEEDDDDEDDAAPSDEHISSTLFSAAIEDKSAQDSPFNREAQEIVDVIITEVCREVAAQTKATDELPAHEIESEGTNLPIVNGKEGHEKEDIDSPESCVDTEIEQSTVDNISNGIKCGDKTQCMETVDDSVDHSEQKSSDKLSSDVENDVLDTPLMERDILGNSSEKAVLETSVSDVVRVEILRGNDEDLDID